MIKVEEYVPPVHGAGVALFCERPPWPQPQPAATLGVQQVGVLKAVHGLRRACEPQRQALHGDHEATL